MADISRIQGPGGPIEPGGKKEKSPTDPEKFKELMKVEKVREIDPEEQKKRKRREEAEEEEQKNPEPSPQPPVSSTPFISEKGGSELSISSSSASGATTPSIGTSASEDSFFKDIEVFMEQFNESIKDEKTTTPPQSQTPSLPPATSEVPKEQTPSVAAPPSTQTVQSPDTSAESSDQQQPPLLSRPPGGEKKKPSAPKETFPLPKSQRAEAISAPSPSEGQAPKEALETEKNLPKEQPPSAPTEEQIGIFFGTLSKPSEKESAHQPSSDILSEGEISGLVSQPAQTEQGKKGDSQKRGKEEEIAATAEIQKPGEIPPALQGIPLASGPLPPYVNLHPQVLDMFERMVGVMTIMVDSGIRETTVTLNAPQFAASVFFGSQIIIQEFSTAPNAYNIQFIGNSNAVALFQGNADDLLAAFQSGNYNFRINRLEASLSSGEKPLFKRKEGVSGNQKDFNQQT